MHLLSGDLSQSLEHVLKLEVFRKPTVLAVPQNFCIGYWQVVGFGGVWVDERNENAGLKQLDEFNGEGLHDDLTVVVLYFDDFMAVLSQQVWYLHFLGSKPQLTLTKMNI